MLDSLRRSRPAAPMRSAAKAVACAALVALTGACRSSNDASPRKSTTSVTVNRFPAIGIQVNGDAPAPVLDGVHAALDRYLAAAVVTALQTGTAADLTAVFTTDALGGASGPDRPTLTDEGLPGVTELRSSSALATVTALADQVASANVELTVVAMVGKTPVTIHRDGEIALVAEPGGWRIDGYELHVTRDSQDVPASTSTSRKPRKGVKR